MRKIKVTEENNYTEERFKALLRELFQFARSDLNFGIYRVMNQKRGKVDEFIDQRIVAAVDGALKESRGGGKKSGVAPQEMLRDMIIHDLGEEAFDVQNRLRPAHHSSKLGKLWLSLEEALGKAAIPASGLRDRVFNCLWEFFNRYYDEGDFMCRRRHSAAKRYAVPYNGEEVLLHWANRDQYYIKTTEQFSRYEYKTGGGVVRFEMRQAELPADNNKEQEKRYFIPLIEKFAVKKGGLCILPFHYRPLDGKEKAHFGKNKVQDGIIEKALKKLKKNSGAAPLFAVADQDGKREIERHLYRYVRRNTADYFIHKNLGRFLREELDFYIKNEVLIAEEVVQPGENTQAHFAVAEAVRTAGELTINFLAQLENFQKAIWEKKKFITATEYYVAAGQVAEELQEEVVSCTAQWKQWHELNFCSAKMSKKEKIKFLCTHPSLPLDTACFNAAFKDQLLASFDNLDEMTDGVLFHGENWQALNIMQEKYRERVKCVYIDPPYNTQASEILYKNDYKHSAWLAMMENRLESGKNLLMEDGFHVVTIDRAELHGLGILTDQIFGMGNQIGMVTVFINPKGRQHERFFSSCTEYMLLHAKNVSMAKFNKTTIIDEKLKEFRNTDGKGRYRLDSFARIRNSTTAEKKSNFCYPIYVSKDLSTLTLEKINGYHEVYPENGNKKRFSWKVTPETFLQNNEKGMYVARWDEKKEKLEVYNKFYENQVFHNLWNNKKYYPEFKGGNQLIESIFGERNFLYPKSVYAIGDIIKITGNKNGYVLDYFAGSGTTAHAVINLNREDGGRRKFILVEMGEYFNTVLLPRIQKIMFSPEWQAGKPKRHATKQEADRAPRLIKYHRFEAYDDALDNIAFDEKIGQAAMPFADYVHCYMLQNESRACATFSNNEMLQNPFSYALAGLNGKTATADLPETFAYLIGLHEHKRFVMHNGKNRYVIQKGKADGHQTTVIWRNTKDWEKRDYEKDRKFVQDNKLTKHTERIYVNDDSIIRNTESLTPVFRDKMFGGNNE